MSNDQDVHAMLIGHWELVIGHYCYSFVIPASTFDIHAKGIL
jgi:hypothetical protein